MSFSYMNNKIELYVNADSGIASLADMAGKKLGVQSGSFAEEVLTDYEQYDEFEKSLGEVLGFDEYLTALMDLQAGNIDGVLMDLVVGEYRLAGMDGNNIVAAVSLEDDNYGIGFRKEDVELRDKVEEILREMAADGKVAEIASNWFGSDISTIQ